MEMKVDFVVFTIMGFGLFLLVGFLIGLYIGNRDYKKYRQDLLIDTKKDPKPFSDEILDEILDEKWRKLNE
jgi:uncharacterized protein YneF (UPF0154 family)